MSIATAFTLTSATSITTTDTATTGVLVQHRGRTWTIVTSLGTVTGTSPTLDITVQHSLDNTNWVTLSTVTQRVAASANTTLYTVPATATDYLRPVYPYVRAIYTIGGSSSPTFNTVSIKLYLE